MPNIPRILSFVFRAGEFAFAAVVTGIVGAWLDAYGSSNTYGNGRFIYIIIVSAISILLSCILSLPSLTRSWTWLVDAVTSLAWFAAFGVLVSFLDITCNRSSFYWGGWAGQQVCDHWRVAQAFSFVSGLFWMFSAILGGWLIHHQMLKNGERVPPVVARDRFMTGSRYY